LAAARFPNSVGVVRLTVEKAWGLLSSITSRYADSFIDERVRPSHLSLNHRVFFLALLFTRLFFVIIHLVQGEKHAKKEKGRKAEHIFFGPRASIVGH